MKIILTLLFIFCFSSAALAGITKAQTGVKVRETGNTVASCVFGSDPGPGDLVLIGTEWYSGTPGDSATMTVADSNGNNYTVEPHDSGTTNVHTAGQVLQAYLINAPSNASKTITVTYSLGFAAAIVWCDDFSVTGGTAAYDSGAYASGVGTINTPTIPVTGATDLLFSVATDNADTAGVNPPWNANVVDLEVPFQVLIEDREHSVTHVLAGRIDRIDRTKNGYEIIICTARDDIKPVEDWLKEWDFPDIEVTNVKPKARWYVDDRAIRFINWEDTYKYF